MPHAADTHIMGTLVRILLLGVIVVMPGGLLLLPVLAYYQLRHNKKAGEQAAPSSPIVVRM